MREITITKHVIANTEDGRHNVEVHKMLLLQAGVEIARLLWEVENAEVYALWVDDKFRRTGIATKLWQEAQKHSTPPVHSANRTDDGDKWALSLQADLPERVKV